MRLLPIAHPAGVGADRRPPRRVGGRQAGPGAAAGVTGGPGAPAAAGRGREDRRRGRGKARAPARRPDPRGLRRARGREAAADRAVPCLRAPPSRPPLRPDGAAGRGGRGRGQPRTSCRRATSCSRSTTSTWSSTASRATRKALERFLDEDLRPEDQVALVTTSGASALSQEFTSDRAVLRQTLSRLSAQGRHADWSGVPHISDYQAELIEGGDPMALDAAIQEILQSGDPPGRGLGRAGGPTQVARRLRRGRLQLAADARDAREPLSGPLGAHGPQGALPRLGRLPHRPLRAAAAWASTCAASPTRPRGPVSSSTRSTPAASLASPPALRAESPLERGPATFGSSRPWPGAARRRRATR